MLMSSSRLLAPWLLLAASPLAAYAHATFETAAVPQGSHQKVVLRVPHGCKGEPTNAVKITIPDGIVGVKPMPKAGWALDVYKGPLAKPYHSHGREITEGVKAIMWSGGNLPDGFYDEFVFTAQFTEALPVGKKVFIPVVQTCPKGEAAWTQIPAEGSGEAKLETPAPAIRILAKAAGVDEHAGHGAAPAALASGPMRIEQAWTRATPNGAKVAGGFLKITNSGTTPDRLIGGSVEIAGLFEIHEMKSEGSIMKMRALVGGLEIKPGESVELKPGGYHVMLLDLKSQIREGDVIKGELLFEKAGKVPVEFKAGGMGAGAPMQQGHQHHSHGH